MSTDTETPEQSASAETLRAAINRDLWPHAAHGQPRLTVRLHSFPESNGKRNWTDTAGGV